MGLYEKGRRVDGLARGLISIDGLPAIGFSHPRLQEVLLGWAESRGAFVLRPAKVVGVGDGQGATVSVLSGGHCRSTARGWSSVPTARPRVFGAGCRLRP